MNPNLFFKLSSVELEKLVRPKNDDSREQSTVHGDRRETELIFYILKKKKINTGWNWQVCQSVAESVSQSVIACLSMTAAARPSLTLTLSPPDRHALSSCRQDAKEGRKEGREGGTRGVGGNYQAVMHSARLLCTPFHTLPLLVTLSPHPSHRLGRSYLQPLVVRAWFLRSLLRPSLSLSLPLSRRARAEFTDCAATRLVANQLRVEWRSTQQGVSTPNTPPFREVNIEFFTRVLLVSSGRPDFTDWDKWEKSKMR